MKMIKSLYVCHKCKHSIYNCFESHCKDCPMADYDADPSFCKCSTIKIDEECPYFEEDKDEDKDEE